VNNRLRNAANVADRRNPPALNPASPDLICAMFFCENPNCDVVRESYGAGYRCWKCGHVPIQTVHGAREAALNLPDPSLAPRSTHAQCENPNCDAVRESYGAGYACQKCGHVPVPVQTVHGPHGAALNLPAPVPCGSAGPPPAYGDTRWSPLVSPGEFAVDDRVLCLYRTDGKYYPGRVVNIKWNISSGGWYMGRLYDVKWDDGHTARARVASELKPADKNAKTSKKETMSW